MKKIILMIFCLGMLFPLLGSAARPYGVEEIPNVQAGQFLHVARRWQDGDTVRLLLDLHPRIVYGQENPPTHGAVLYGALVLARDKRVSEVGTPVTLGEQVEVTRIPNPPIPCQGMFEVASGKAADGGLCFRWADVAAGQRDGSVDAAEKMLKNRRGWKNGRCFEKRTGWANRQLLAAIFLVA